MINVVQKKNSKILQKHTLLFHACYTRPIEMYDLNLQQSFTGYQNETLSYISVAHNHLLKCNPNITI